MCILCSLVHLPLHASAAGKRGNMYPACKIDSCNCVTENRDFVYNADKEYFQKEVYTSCKKSSKHGSLNCACDTGGV